MGDSDEPATVTDAAAAAARATHRDSASPAGDRYRLGERIGRGGMGEVIAARDEQIGRDVAIKRILADTPSEARVERFLREARIQGRLEHPAIVPVHELGRDASGLPYFAMKKLSGTTLSEILATKLASRQRLLRAFVDVCLAVEFAHVHGVVHRDLKPSNIMLGEFGEVYVLDWGVAKIVGEAEVTGDLVSGEGLTAVGAAVGTPGFMAPEQARGEDVDERADVYALGRVLGEILDSDAVPELDTLCTRATAADRDTRLASARELADHVQRYLDGDRDLALRRQLARDQLAKARASLDAGDRTGAIEAAGRALALDPQLEEASTLVSALILQPPRETPPEVQRALDDDARAWGRSRARGVLRTHLAYILAAAALIANAQYAYLPLLVAALAPLVVVGLLGVRGRWLPPPWLLPLLMAPMIALVAHMFSPYVVAPGLAAVSGINLALDPKRRHWGALVAMYVAAVLLPLAAERIGLVGHTVEYVRGTIVLHAPGLFSGTTQDLLFAAYVLVIIGAGVGLGRALRDADLQQRTRLHTITWHLGHLIPARNRGSA